METIIIAAASLFLSVALALAAVVWKIAGIRTEVADVKSAAIAEVAKYRLSIDNDIGTLRHDFGEVATAIRQKLTDMELWNRDTFLRRESFIEINRTVLGNIREIADKVDRWGEKLQEKIEKLQQRVAAQEGPPAE